METWFVRETSFDRKEATENNERIIKAVVEQNAIKAASNTTRISFGRQVTHRRSNTAAQSSRSSVMSSGRQLPNGEWAD